MNTTEKEILEIAKEVIERNNFVLIDSVFRGERGSKVIQFFIDGKQSVTSDVCAEISKETGSLIDEKLPDLKSYRLEISSPGVERPLKYYFQYIKNLNRKFTVEYEAENGAGKITGKLTRAEENENLVFQVNKDEITINFNKITKANVLISFS